VFTAALIASTSPDSAKAAGVNSSMVVRIPNEKDKRWRVTIACTDHDHDRRAQRQTSMISFSLVLFPNLASMMFIF
jgi:hypothetical protein